MRLCNFNIHGNTCRINVIHIIFMINTKILSKINFIWKQSNKEKRFVRLYVFTLCHIKKMLKVVEGLKKYAVNRKYLMFKPLIVRSICETRGREKNAEFNVSGAGNNNTVLPVSAISISGL